MNEIYYYSFRIKLSTLAYICTFLLQSAVRTDLLNTFESECLKTNN